MEAPPIGEHETEEMLSWLETMSFSRAPKNLTRDFSDGVLVAEIMRHQFPQLVHLHNYQPASSSAAKYVNWKTLNEKVFKKLSFQLNKNDIESIIANSAGAIERVLYLIYTKMIGLQIDSQNNIDRTGSKLFDFGSLKKIVSIEEEKLSSSFAKELSSQLAEKETVIRELRETIEILEAKMKKMEQLNKLKDTKIDSLMKKIDESIGI